MARQYNNTNTESGKNEWKEIVPHVLIRKSGNSEFFSVNWYGAIIHGCSVRSGKTGDFISWPAFKNAEGKYVKRAYIWAEQNTEDAETLNRIVYAVKNM